MVLSIVVQNPESPENKCILHLVDLFYTLWIKSLLLHKSAGFSPMRLRSAFFVVGWCLYCPTLPSQTSVTGERTKLGVRILGETLRLDNWQNLWGWRVLCWLGLGSQIKLLKEFFPIKNLFWSNQWFGLASWMQPVVHKVVCKFLGANWTPLMLK